MSSAVSIDDVNRRICGLLGLPIASSTIDIALRPQKPPVVTVTTMLLDPPRRGEFVTQHFLLVPVPDECPATEPTNDAHIEE